MNFYNKKNIIAVIFALLIVTAFYMFRGDYSMTPSFQDDTFTFDGPQGIYISEPFENVTGVCFYDGMDLGECTTGGSQYGYVYGTYTNDTLGDYTLASLKKVSCYIAVTSDDGSVFAFNMESRDTTTNLYDAMLKLFESEGYSIEHN